MSTLRLVCLAMVGVGLVSCGPVVIPAGRAPAIARNGASFRESFEGEVKGLTNPGMLRSDPLNAANRVADFGGGDLPGYEIPYPISGSTRELELRFRGWAPAGKAGFLNIRVYDERGNSQLYQIDYRGTGRWELMGKILRPGDRSRRILIESTMEGWLLVDDVEVIAR